MKKIYLIVSCILLVTICSGCIPRYSFDLIEELEKAEGISAQDIISKHENIWGIGKVVPEGQPADMEISSFVDEILIQVFIEIGIDDYTCKAISGNGIVVYDKNNDKVAFITLTEKSSKKSDDNLLKEFNDFKVASTYDWRCHEAMIDGGKTKMFIFEDMTTCGQNGYNCNIEISGTNLDALEKLISGYKATVHFMANYDAIFG